MMLILRTHTLIIDAQGGISMTAQIVRPTVSEEPVTFVESLLDGFDLELAEAEMFAESMRQRARHFLFGGSETLHLGAYERKTDTHRFLKEYMEPDDAWYLSRRVKQTVESITMTRLRVDNFYTMDVRHRTAH